MTSLFILDGGWEGREEREVWCGLVKAGNEAKTPPMANRKTRANCEIPLRYDCHSNRPKRRSLLVSSLYENGFWQIRPGVEYSCCARRRHLATWLPPTPRFLAYYYTQTYCNAPIFGRSPEERLQANNKEIFAGPLRGDEARRTSICVFAHSRPLQTLCKPLSCEVHHEPQNILWELARPKCNLSFFARAFFSIIFTENSPTPTRGSAFISPLVPAGTAAARKYLRTVLGMLPGKATGHTRQISATLLKNNAVLLIVLRTNILCVLRTAY